MEIEDELKKAKSEADAMEEMQKSRRASSKVDSVTGMPIGSKKGPMDKRVSGMGRGKGQNTIGLTQFLITKNQIIEIIAIQFPPPPH